jgi:hypothetical protein
VAERYRKKDGFNGEWSYEIRLRNAQRQHRSVILVRALSKLPINIEVNDTCEKCETRTKALHQNKLAIRMSQAVDTRRIRNTVLCIGVLPGAAYRMTRSFAAATTERGKFDEERKRRRNAAGHALRVGSPGKMRVTVSVINLAAGYLDSADSLVECAWPSPCSVTNRPG